MEYKWIVTGDTHGDMSRFKNIESLHPETINIIILGDAGCNYYCNLKDLKPKKALKKTGFNYYLLRGNHEARPAEIDTMIRVWDDKVGGEVYMEENFPTIRYFIDGGIYTIDGFKVLTIGGAYSIDKFYRLATNKIWYSNEQLSDLEKTLIEERVKGESFDFVLTHTCPYDWRPTDLFLLGINQNEVDVSMEKWLNRLKDKIGWKVWLFGHFHDTRIELPRVEMYFHGFDELRTIWSRWEERTTIEWWLTKGPKYYLYE